jgi:hypothetical protein
MRGVGVLYRELKHHLVDVAPRVSPLQVVSKLEEFLTKEFCSVILKKSGNSVLPLTGAGNRSDGRRIDLALVQGNLSRAVDTQSMKVVRQKMKVRAFIELKYLRNKHRFGFGNASDEIESTLKDLRKQIGTFRKSSYGDYGVKLRARTKDIYGVVVVSYVRRADLRIDKQASRDDREVFLETILASARKNKLRFYDLTYPRLEAIYIDRPVQVLKARFMISLYAGLWRASA